MVEAFSRFGLEGRMPSSGLRVDSPLAERHAFAAMSENGIGAIFDTLVGEVAEPAGVATAMTTIAGIDGNDVTLHITRPTGASEPMPAVVHLHGGGMAINTAADL